MAHPVQTNHVYILEPSILTPGSHIQYPCVPKDILKSCQNNTINNIPRLEATQMSINCRMEK